MRPSRWRGAYGRGRFVTVTVSTLGHFYPMAYRIGLRKYGARCSAWPSWRAATWPALAETACSRLTAERGGQDLSTSLLVHIRAVFDGTDRTDGAVGTRRPSRWTRYRARIS